MHFVVKVLYSVDNIPGDNHVVHIVCKNMDDALAYLSEKLSPIGYSVVDRQIVFCVEEMRFKRLSFSSTNNIMVCGNGKGDTLSTPHWTSIPQNTKPLRIERSHIVKGRFNAQKR
jgi:hypothetical protein